MPSLEERVDELERSTEKRKNEMQLTIHQAVNEAMSKFLLSEEEHGWVKLAIKKEAQSIAFRHAVIEKSLTALVIAAGGWLCLVLKEYFTLHGWKP